MNIISYVLRMREQLMKSTAIARENLLQAQIKQKEWYDLSARQQSFEPGSPVAVANKLLSKWQGPYQISR